MSIEKRRAIQETLLTSLVGPEAGLSLDEAAVSIHLLCGERQVECPSFRTSGPQDLRLEPSTLLIAPLILREG